MPFNSSALSAGLGSMLQGIQQNAQQKLQLAQMERQQNIENANLQHQREMEKFALQNAGLETELKRGQVPITLDMAGMGRDLFRQTMPFQVESQRLGVEGQRIANRGSEFQVGTLMPLNAEGVKIANRTGAAGAKVAEGTVDANIGLANQGFQANKFGAASKAQDQVDGALAQLRRAKTLLDNPTTDFKTQQLAHTEYQAAQQVLSKFPNLLGMISNPDYKDLFGDTSQLRASVIKGLGGTPENIADPNFDMTGLINTFAPSRTAPVMGKSPEIQNYIGNLIGNTMGADVMSPNPAFINRKGLNFDAKGNLVGNYQPSSVDAGALAKFSYPSFVARVKATAMPAAGITPREVFTAMGFTPDMLGVDGTPKIEDKRIADKTYRIMKGYYTAPQGLNDAIRKYEGDNLQALQEQVKTRIANLNKEVGIKASQAQVEATLKQLEYPMIQNYQNAYSTALNRLDRLNKGLENLNVTPKDLVVIANAWPKIKKSLSAEQQAIGDQLIKERDFVINSINESNAKFIDPKFPSGVRAANAIQVLVGAGIAMPPSTGGIGDTGGAAGGAAGGFGVSPNLKFDPPNFQVTGPAPKQ